MDVANFVLSKAGAIGQINYFRGRILNRSNFHTCSPMAAVTDFFKPGRLRPPTLESKHAHTCDIRVYRNTGPESLAQPYRHSKFVLIRRRLSK